MAKIGDEQPIRVLVIDDEDGLRSSLSRLFRQRGMTVATAADGAAGLELVASQSFDVVLVDVQMPVLTGPEFVERVRKENYPVEVVMMTAYADLEVTERAVKLGAFGFLTKPFVSNESVVIEVSNAARMRRLRERNEHLQQALSQQSSPDEMLGSSPSLQEVNRLIDGVATANSTVLVLGESGTGKELVARAIHQRSRRAKKPLVTVNCAAIPKELVESELFGHTRGAFTSAMAARAGLFEAAHGGTIFLDEIGDLPLAAQVKLLRTLQEGEVKPVGSDVVKTVDVRVVAATNADLKGAIAAGTFRADLFYRLNVIAVNLPPLRERGDDVLLLAHHFIRKQAKKITGRAAPSLGAEAAHCLLNYSWPGNVRELEHAIERAVVLCQGTVITPDTLPTDVVKASPPPSIPVARKPSVAPASDRDALAGLSLEELARLPYADAKRRVVSAFNAGYVKAIVASAGNNMSDAARRSGLDRSNFRRLLRTVEDDDVNDGSTTK